MHKNIQYPRASCGRFVSCIFVAFSSAGATAPPTHAGQIAAIFHFPSIISSIFHTV